mgnify:CR=1 FL=1
MNVRNVRDYLINFIRGFDTIWVVVTALAFLIVLTSSLGARPRGQPVALATTPVFATPEATPTATREGVAIVRSPQKTPASGRKNKPPTSMPGTGLPYPLPVEETPEPIVPVETEAVSIEPSPSPTPPLEPLSEDVKKEYIDFLVADRKYNPTFEIIRSMVFLTHPVLSTGKFETREITLPSGNSLLVDILWAYTLTPDTDLIEVPVVIGFPLEEGKYFRAENIPIEFNDRSLPREEHLARVREGLPAGTYFSLINYPDAVTPMRDFDWDACKAGTVTDKYNVIQHPFPCELAEWMDSQYPGVLQSFAEGELDAVPEGWLVLGFLFIM